MSLKKLQSSSVLLKVKPKSNYIYYVTLILTFFFLNSEGFAQNHEQHKARIAEIKKWYSEIQAIGLRNCVTKKYTDYDAPFDPNVKIPFPQVINSCQINNIYLLKKGHFRGHEWEEYMNVYLRNEKIFFVLISGSSESNLYEKRYYCDGEEKIILQLDRNSENGEKLGDTNTEFTENLKKWIRSAIDLKAFELTPN